MKPLNGTKTHPLKQPAIEVLRALSVGPTPCQSINPGVTNRLLREQLVEGVMLPSPFKTHNGKSIYHLVITAAGRAKTEGTKP